jgi:hypothetical protein
VVREEVPVAVEFRMLEFHDYLLVHKTTNTIDATKHVTGSSTAVAAATKSIVFIVHLHSLYTLNLLYVHIVFHV